jgi:hypothetical protein
VHHRPILHVEDTNTVTIFLSRNNKPTAFNIIKARSFQRIDTMSHRNTPIVEEVKSNHANSVTPRIDMDIRMKKDATHFKYQSMVYLGVADLKILLEFSNSFLVNLLMKTILQLY